MRDPDGRTTVPVVVSEEPGTVIARFLECRGYRVIEACGALWWEFRRGFYESLPCHRRFDPEPDRVGAMVKALGAAGARYPSLTRPGLPSGLHVCRPQSCSLASLPPRQRARVKRGLQSFTFGHVGAHELLAQGMQLNRETLARQSRNDPEFLERRHWERFVRAAADCPGVSVVGAFRENRLAAYLVHCRDGNWVHILCKMSRDADLRARCNYGLDFWTIQDIAADRSVERVSNGFLSAPGPSGVDEYKSYVGYHVEPHPMGIQFHPRLVSVLTNRYVVRMADSLQNLCPRTPQFAIMAAVLRGGRASRTGGAL